MNSFGGEEIYSQTGHWVRQHRAPCFWPLRACAVISAGTHHCRQVRDPGDPVALVTAWGFYKCLGLVESMAGMYQLVIVCCWAYYSLLFTRRISPAMLLFFFVHERNMHIPRMLTWSPTSLPWFTSRGELCVAGSSPMLCQNWPSPLFLARLRWQWISAAGWAMVQGRLCIHRQLWWMTIDLMRADQLFTTPQSISWLMKLIYGSLPSID